MQKNNCPLCVGSDDELTGGHDPNCPVIIHEDDQERAAAYEIMDQPDDMDPGLTERIHEVTREVLAFLRFKRDLGR